MFKVILPLVSAATLAIGGSWVLVNAQQPPIATPWIASLTQAAQTMQVVLTDECIEAIKLHVRANGFERAAVTNRGSVMIRDANRIDTWVCP